MLVRQMNEGRAEVENEFSQGGSAPAHVEREFRRYLECGILAHGFARARCAECGHDFLIAWSCKGRGVCPACNARRMVETAAHLADHVIPRLPVRQWVLSVPKRLRYYLQSDPSVQNLALHIFLSAVEQGLRQCSRGAGAGSRIGAVAFIHRFGALLNPHLHFHCVVVDGVFESDGDEQVHFHEAHALAPEALDEIQAKVRLRLLRALTRRGLLERKDAQAMAGAGAETPVVAAATPAPNPPNASPEVTEEPAHRRAARYAWALLLARIYEVFALLCPKCGGAIRIIAFITEAVAVRDILAHLGEPTSPPRMAPARGPPLWEISDAAQGESDPQAQPAPDYEFDQRLAW